MLPCPIVIISEFIIIIVTDCDGSSTWQTSHLAFWDWIDSSASSYPLHPFLLAMQQRNWWTTARDNQKHSDLVPHSAKIRHTSRKEARTSKTTKARMGERSIVPPNGGIIPRNRLRYGSQIVANGVTITWGGLGNHVRTNRPIKAALYRLRNWFNPVVMTCSATPSPGMIAAKGLCLRKWTCGSGPTFFTDSSNPPSDLHHNHDYSMDHFVSEDISDDVPGPFFQDSCVVHDCASMRSEELLYLFVKQMSEAIGSLPRDVWVHDMYVACVKIVRPPWGMLGPRMEAPSSGTMDMIQWYVLHVMNTWNTFWLSELHWYVDIGPMMGWS